MLLHGNEVIGIPWLSIILLWGIIKSIRLCSLTNCGLGHSWAAAYVRICRLTKFTIAFQYKDSFDIGDLSNQQATMAS